MLTECEEVETEENIESDSERIAEVMRRVGAVLSAEELSTAEKHSVLSTLIQSIKPEEAGYTVELRTLPGQQNQTVKTTLMHCSSFSLKIE